MNIDIKGLLEKIVGYNEKMKDVHTYWRVDMNIDGKIQWKKIYVLDDKESETSEGLGKTDE